ncbi:reverse transcriptase domain-containing protein [Tanacetum coccineum]
MLVAPMEKEELIVYLAAAKETVSAVLMTEQEAKQMPIYFVNRALRGPKVNYTSMEKLVLPLVHASKCLKRYFQAHPIIVIMDQPIQQVLSRPEVEGRLQKWSIELGEYAIHYRPRVSIKGQILADFIVEQPEEESPDTLMGEEEELPKHGSCLRKDHLAQIVPRSKNKKADALSKIASTSFAHLSKQVLVDELKEKSISTVEVLAVVEKEGGTWMTPIFKYLMDGTLPTEVKKARAVKRRKKADKGWGIDIAGPFPEGPGRVKFLIVAIDYFTKWIEAKPVATITGNQIKKFMWDNIVCRFRLPGEIISDNGKQFQDNPFKDWCEKLCIRQHFASVKHPQTNGLVERANRSLEEGIKASNVDTLFLLKYGTEAVIPAEIGMPTLRTAEVDLVQNDEALEINLDLLEERREQAAI